MEETRPAAPVRETPLKPETRLSELTAPEQRAISRHSRPNAAIIVLLTYVIALAQLAHVVAGSVEVFYLIVAGAAGWGDYLLHFLPPVLAGNVLGGVALVAALAYGQAAADLEQAP